MDDRGLLWTILGSILPAAQRSLCDLCFKSTPSAIPSSQRTFQPSEKRAKKQD